MLASTYVHLTSMLQVLLFDACCLVGFTIPDLMPDKQVGCWQPNGWLISWWAVGNPIDAWLVWMV